MKDVVITLYPGMGADLGPIFTLSPDIGSIIPNVSTKTFLLAGLTASIDDLATDVSIISIGDCTNTLTLSLTTTTTTTLII